MARSHRVDPSAAPAATVDAPWITDAPEPFGVVAIPIVPSVFNANSHDPSLVLNPDFEISAETVAGVQSSHATRTRNSMSPVMSSAAVSGVVHRDPDAPVNASSAPQSACTRHRRIGSSDP